MVKPIFLCSLKERVGKSFLSIGIMQKLQKEGKKVAYFKPVGISKSAFTAKADPDVGFILNTIYPTTLPYEIISPVSLPDCYYIDLINDMQKDLFLKKIKNAYAEISKEVDYVIIEGSPSIRKFIRVGLDDVSIAQAIGVKDLLYVETESSDKCMDNLFFTKQYFDLKKLNFKGVIFNKIDFDYTARIKELEAGHIKKFNIPIIGVIEKTIELIAPRVIEIMESMGGELINNPSDLTLNNRVDTYLIGAMNPQAAQKFLRQVKRGALITGGDRTDLLLAALEQNMSCLIVTGYIQPDIKVITAANEKNIPIILSPSDTYTTMRNMDRVKAGFQKDELKFVMEYIEKFINWDLLFS